jgi:hypothetical protein
VGGISRPGARALVDEALVILLRDLQIVCAIVAAAGGLTWLASRSVPPTKQATA